MRQNIFSTFVVVASILLCSMGSHAQSSANCFLLKAPHQKLAPGSSCISVKVNGFAEAGLFQFSMDWPGLQFLDTAHLNLNTQIIITLDSSELSNAKLGFSVLNMGLSPLPDNTTLFEICIDRAAFSLDSSTVSFSGSIPLTSSLSITGEEKGFQYTNGTISLINEVSDLRIEELCVNYDSCTPLRAAIEIETGGGIPPYTYDWVGPNGFQKMTEDIAIQELEEGEYTVTLMDSVGDTHTAWIEVLRPQLAPQGYYIQHVNCFGDSTGFIEISPNDISANLTYQWSNAAADTTITQNLPIGNYSVTISDELGCSWQKDFVVNEPSEIISDEIEVFCAGAGEANGDIDLNLSGGIAPYTTVWSNGSSVDGGKKYNLAAGFYEVTITDQATCTVVLSNLEIPEGGNLELLDNSAFCLGDSVDLFIAIPAGATLTHLWPLDGVSCNPCTPPFFVKPTQTTNYEIRMEDATCTYLEVSPVLVDDWCVWPGDTDTSKVVNHFDLLSIGIAHGSSGPPRTNASIAWRAEPGTYWMQSTPQTLVDYKHIDTDGNGLINDADTIAISQNWGETHNFEGNGSSEYTSQSGNSASGTGVPFYLQTDTIEEGESYVLEVILGEEDTPASDVYGLAFSLYYDPDVVVPGSASLSLESSWLGADSDLLLLQRTDLSEGRVDLAFTRRNGIGLDGYGQIASFNITIEDDIFLQGSGTSQFALGQEAVFDIRNVRAIDDKEIEIIIGARPSRAVIGKTSTGIVENWLQKQIDVYPNPAQKEVFIKSLSVELESLKLYNMTGVKIGEWTPAKKETLIGVTEWAEGVYWLQINTTEGVLMERLIILK